MMYRKQVFLAGAALAALAFVSPADAQVRPQSWPLAAQQAAQTGIGGVRVNPVTGAVDRIKGDLYATPVRTRDITPEEITGRSYRTPVQSSVAGKISELESQIGALQGAVSHAAGDFNSLQRENEERAAEYYADIATISTQLHAGTTPGNPRLTEKVRQAEGSLENLGNGAIALSQLSAEAARQASEASFMLEAIRAAYGVSGAVEEDHVRLAELEDEVSGTTVLIERLLNNINDDITRTNTYLGSERTNLRTLALAVSNGDLYGKSLASRPFSSAAMPFDAAMAPGDGLGPADTLAPQQTVAAPAPAYAGGLGAPRQLARIKFDRPDVDYEQAVYMVVNDTLQKYPNARFNLVAVNPTQGNAAEVAIESTRARRNAEKVLRTLTQMGLSMDRIDLSYNQSADARTNEVHLFVR